MNVGQTKGLRNGQTVSWDSNTCMTWSTSRYRLGFIVDLTLRDRNFGALSNHWLWVTVVMTKRIRLWEEFWFSNFKGENKLEVESKQTSTYRCCSWLKAWKHIIQSNKLGIFFLSEGKECLQGRNQSCWFHKNFHMGINCGSESVISQSMVFGWMNTSLEDKRKRVRLRMLRMETKNYRRNVSKNGPRVRWQSSKSWESHGNAILAISKFGVLDLKEEHNSIMIYGVTTGNKM